jgi:ABC-type multidrug transport system fused ATPase/permease subunit
VVAVGAIAVMQILIWYFARALVGDSSVLGRSVSVVLGFLSAILVASLGEWSVHRYTMHRPWRNRILNVPYSLHHKAHHFREYTPDRFTHAGPVKYHPTHDPNALVDSNLARAWVAVQYFSYYTMFGIVLFFLPAWFITINIFFMIGLVPPILCACMLFVHVHNVTHHPAHHLVERFHWFHFLKHHHYIHHIDYGCNVNFLLPLCDLLMGTLRRSLEPREIARWGTYEEALVRVVPVNDGRA